ncbi:MAG: ATP-binding protein [Verrucomicrobiales bacterium]|nr:ATP-binding protein [Verrucomicrobiales bacterium]
MKIETLQLCNFRQFYGTTPKLEFSSGEKSTTVIHASNGGGKTALLNAFTWTLYESFSPGFLYPKQLINKRALRESDQGKKVEAWVRIEFEHDDYHYSVKRSVSAVPSGDCPIPDSGDSVVEMGRIGKGGKWEVIKNTEKEIGRILPDALHRYFFFDGERIEKIVRPDKGAQQDLEEATKMFLGIEVLTRAETHLYEQKRDLEKNLKSVGDAETASLLSEKENKEEEKASTQALIVELIANIEGEISHQAKLTAALRDEAAAQALQVRRDQLEQELKTREKSQEQNISMLKNEISSRAYSVFLESSAEKFSSLLESLEARGELPAGIKINFVNDLLSKEECICGTSLAPGNNRARELVEKWKARAGLVEVEDKAIRMKGEIRQIRNYVDPFWESIDEIENKRASDKGEISRIEEELEDISTRLTGSSEENVARMEELLAASKAKVKDWERDQTLARHRVEQFDLEISDLDTRIEKHQSKEARQRLIQRRISVTGESIQVIRDIRVIMEEGMRKSLQTRIRRLFARMSVTSYSPELTQAFTLRLLESSGGAPAPVASSQGENQLLSFSFIGAIVEEAKAWNEKHKNLPGPNSEQYPIVMDSPFGALDPVYRSSIADHLNILADQVVLLLTKTQWRGEVEVSIRHKVAKEYVVTYNSTKEDVEHDHIELHGEKYETVRQSDNDFEYSTIQLVQK